MVLRALAAFLKFLDRTKRRTTVGWTTVDERSAGRRDVTPPLPPTITPSQETNKLFYSVLSC